MDRNTVKIRKKSEVWAKHGKHRSVLMEVRALQRRPNRTQEWFASVRECMKRGSK